MDGEQGSHSSEQKDEKGFHRGVPNATGGCSHDRCYSGSGDRADKTADNRCSGNAARRRADEAAIDCDCSAAASTCNNEGSCRGSTDRRWPILNRSSGEGSLSVRYRGVGKRRLQGLSLRRKQELRDHEERRVHVRKGHCIGGVPSREERKAPLTGGRSWDCSTSSVAP